MTDPITQTSSNPYLSNQGEEDVKAQTEMMKLAEEEAQENVVKKDLRFLNTFFGKFMTQLSSTLEPLTVKITKRFSAGLVFLRNLIGEKFLKVLIRMFLVIFFFMILIVAGVKLMSLFKENERESSVSEPTVAPAFYQSYQPSVYATDTEILQLEKELGMLEREMMGFNLKESILNLPTLDFEISF